MKRNELLAKLDQQKRFTSWCARFGLGAVVIIVGFEVIIKRTYGAVYAQSPSLALLPLAILILVGLAGLASMFLNMKRLGLSCPHCGRVLDLRLTRIALVTSRCGKCSGVVIDDDGSKS